MRAFVLVSGLHLSTICRGQNIVSNPSGPWIIRQPPGGPARPLGPLDIAFVATVSPVWVIDRVSQAGI
jgi:hypothetical protein